MPRSRRPVQRLRAILVCTAPRGCQHCCARQWFMQPYTGLLEPEGPRCNGVCDPASCLSPFSPLERDLQGLFAPAADGSAPASSSACTTSTCPLCAARCSGVSPPSARELRSAPPSSSACTASKWPCCAAVCSLRQRVGQLRVRSPQGCNGLVTPLHPQQRPAHVLAAQASFAPLLPSLPLTVCNSVHCCASLARTLPPGVPGWPPRPPAAPPGRGRCLGLREPCGTPPLPPLQSFHRAAGPRRRRPGRSTKSPWGGACCQAVSAARVVPLQLAPTACFPCAQRPAAGLKARMEHGRGWQRHGRVRAKPSHLNLPRR